MRAIDDMIIKNRLSRKEMREFAEGKPVNRDFRNLMKEYYLLADEYRQKTYGL